MNPMPQSTLRRLKSRRILFVGIWLLSMAVSFVVGEMLIVGRFLQLGLGEHYWIYEVVFFIVFSLAYGTVRLRLLNWVGRVLAGLALAYIASFLSYHLVVLIIHSPAGWVVALRNNPILTVFAPSCLVGLIVGGIYVMTLETLNKLANARKVPAVSRQ